MRIHVYSENWHVCPICGAKMKSRQGLAGHTRFLHGGKGYRGNHRAKQEVAPAWAVELTKKLEAMQTDIDNMEYYIALLVIPAYPKEGPALEARIRDKMIKSLSNKYNPVS